MSSRSWIRIPSLQVLSRSISSAIVLAIRAFTQPTSLHFYSCFGQAYFLKNTERQQLNRNNVIPRVISMRASTRSSKETMTMLCTIAIFMIHQVGNTSREDTSGTSIGAYNSMIITNYSRSVMIIKYACSKLTRIIQRRKSIASS
jgi:hypothetical protein